MCRIVALLVTLLVTSNFSQTSLWEVSNGEQNLYIGGTVHLLRPSDYPLPPEFDAAFSASDLLVFETDMASVQNPQMQAQLVSAMTYGTGDRLSNHISKETLSTLEQFFTEKGVPIAAIESYRPSMVAILIAQLSLGEGDMVAEGVDQFYFNRETEASIPIEKLETIEQQIAFISSLGENNPDEFILNAIEDSAEDLESIVVMVDAWRSGNETKLYKEIIQEIEEQYPDVYKSLLSNRNRTWYPKLESMLHSEPTELILVGAGHLVGDKGILAMFRDNGFTVSQFEID